MKHILLAIAIFLISSNSFSQWQSESTNDPFDGKQTTVIGTGNGGSFPYEKPSLVFRKRSDKLDVFVVNAGAVVNKSKLLFFAWISLSSMALWIFSSMALARLSSVLLVSLLNDINKFY